MKPLDKLTALELDDIASDVRSFKNSPAFDYVFASLREKYIQQLLNANVGDLTATSAHASMKVLEDVRNELSVFETESLFRGQQRVKSR